MGCGVDWLIDWLVGRDIFVGFEDEPEDSGKEGNENYCAENDNILLLHNIYYLSIENIIHLFGIIR